MSYVYHGVLSLEQKPQVDGGECARLVQHYLPGIGVTVSWRPGENVVDMLASGRQIEPGTAIATFINGRYPTSGHRHAAFYLGPITSCTPDPKSNSGRCKLLGFRVIDQWGRKKLIAGRNLNLYGRSLGWPISDNGSLFYIIER